MRRSQYLVVFVVVTVVAAVAAFVLVMVGNEAFANLAGIVGIVGAALAVLSLLGAPMARREDARTVLMKLAEAQSSSQAVPGAFATRSLPVTWARLTGPEGLGTRFPTGGDLNTLVAQILRSDHGVVILGESGSGKSTVADTLLTAYVAVTRDDAGSTSVRVPVQVRLGTWDPGRVALVDFAASQIRKSLREFGLQRLSMHELRGAIRLGSARLVLDDLDELSDGTVAVALRDIDAIHGLAPLLLSQPRALKVGDLPTSQFCFVRLLPISALAAADVVTSRALASAHAEEWFQIAEHVEQSPASDQAAMLGTPLFLSLTLDAIARGSLPPQELMAHAFNREDAERKLLQGYVSAAAQSSRRPERRQVTTLRSVAWLMQRANLETFDWVGLARATPWWITAPGVALAVALPLLLLQWMLPLFGGLAQTVGGATLIALSTLGDRASRMRPRIGRMRRAPLRCAAATAVAVAVAGLPFLIHPAFWWAILASAAGMWLGATLVLLIGDQLSSEFVSIERWLVGSGFESRAPSGLGWTISPWRAYLALGVGGISAFGYALLTGFSNIALPDVESGETLDWLVLSIEVAKQVWTIETIVMFAGATTLALVALTLGRGLSTTTSWRRAALSNVSVGALRGLAIAALMIAIPSLATVLGSSDPTSFLEMFGPGPLMVLLQVIVALAVILGPGVVLGAAVTTSARYWIGVAVLTASGRLPFKLEGSLREMATAGLLRRTGEGYRFRHARLKDCVLTDSRYDRSPGAPSSWTRSRRRGGTPRPRSKG